MMSNEPKRARAFNARQKMTVGLLKYKRLSPVCRSTSRFLGGESDDLLAAERSMYLEWKTNGNARGREIATCAAVGEQR